MAQTSDIPLKLIEYRKQSDPVASRLHARAIVEPAIKGHPIGITSDLDFISLYRVFNYMAKIQPELTNLRMRRK